MAYIGELQQAVAATGGYIDVFPAPIQADRAPVNGSDVGLQGQSWVHKSDNAVYFYTGNQWINASGAAGAFDSLTVTPGAFAYTGAGSGFTMTSDTASSIGVTGAATLAITTATGTLSLGTSGAHTTVLGSTDGAAATTIQSGTGAQTFTAGGIFDVNATGALTLDSAAASSLASSLASSDQAVLLHASAADSNIKLKLGDAVGATFVTVTDSADADVVTIDSDGNLTSVNLKLPTTTATDGQLQINNNRFLHGFGGNTFAGTNAGNLTLAGASSNVGVGTSALNGLTTGDQNIGVGAQAGTSINTGSSNVCIGYQAGVVITAASGNVAIGDLVGAALDGNNNTLVGQQAGGILSSGTGNVILGSLSAPALDTGSNNIVLGGTSLNLGTGDGNIIIGDNTAADASNEMRLGYAASTAKTFIYGVRGVTTDVADAVAVLVDSAGQFGTVSSSRRFKENINDMADESSALLNLRPVTFNYKSDSSKSLQYGLIAEEVQEVMPRLAVLDEEGIPSTVKYHELPSLLLNELQKALKRIEALEQKLESK